MNRIEHLSDRSNLLKNPQLAIGTSVSNETDVYDQVLLKWYKIDLNNILSKMIDEAITNALDNYYRSNDNEKKKYKLNINYSDGVFSIYNTGKKVDLSEIDDTSNLTQKEIKQYKYKIELAFGIKNTSSNFSRTAKTAGLHGYGAYIINVFSEFLEVSIFTKDIIYKFNWHGNNYLRSEKDLVEDVKSGIQIRFKPNWKFLNCNPNIISVNTAISVILKLRCKEILNLTDLYPTLVIEGMKYDLEESNYNEVEYDERLVKEIPIELNNFENVSLKLFPSKYKTKNPDSSNPYDDSIIVNGNRFKTATVVTNIYRNILNCVKVEYPECTINYIKKNITIIFSASSNEFEVNNQSKTHLSKPDAREITNKASKKLIENINTEFGDWTFLRGLKKMKCNSSKSETSLKILEASSENDCTLYITDTFERVCYLASKYGTENCGYAYNSKLTNIPSKYTEYIIDYYSDANSVKYVIDAMKELQDYTFEDEEFDQQEYETMKLPFRNCFMNFNLLKYVLSSEYVTKDTIEKLHKGFTKNLVNDVYGIFQKVGNGIWKVNPIIHKLIIKYKALIPLNFILGPSTFDPNIIIDLLIEPSSFNKDSVIPNYYPGYFGHLLINIDNDGYTTSKLIPKVIFSKPNLQDGFYVYKKIIIESIPPTIDHEKFIKKFPTGKFEFANNRLSKITLENYKSIKKLTYRNLGVSMNFDTFEYEYIRSKGERKILQTFKSIIDYTRKLNLKKRTETEYAALLEDLRIESIKNSYKLKVISDKPKMMEMVDITNFDPVHNETMKILKI